MVYWSLHDYAKLELRRYFDLDAPPDLDTLDFWEQFRICVKLKGNLHEIFDVWFFHESIVPSP